MAEFIRMMGAESQALRSDERIAEYTTGTASAPAASAAEILVALVLRHPELVADDVPGTAAADALYAYRCALERWAKMLPSKHPGRAGLAAFGTLLELGGRATDVLRAVLRMANIPCGQWWKTSATARYAATAKAHPRRPHLCLRCAVGRLDTKIDHTAATTDQAVVRRGWWGGGPEKPRHGKTLSQARHQNVKSLRRWPATDPVQKRRQRDAKVAFVRGCGVPVEQIVVVVVDHRLVLHPGDPARAHQTSFLSEDLVRGVPGLRKEQIYSANVDVAVVHDLQYTGFVNAKWMCLDRFIACFAPLLRGRVVLLEADVWCGYDEGARWPVRGAVSQGLLRAGGPPGSPYAGALVCFSCSDRPATTKGASRAEEYVRIVADVHATCDDPPSPYRCDPYAWPSGVNDIYAKTLQIHGYLLAARAAACGAVALASAYAALSVAEAGARARLVERHADATLELCLRRPRSDPDEAAVEAAAERRAARAADVAVQNDEAFGLAFVEAEARRAEAEARRAEAELRMMELRMGEGIDERI